MRIIIKEAKKIFVNFVSQKRIIKTQLGQTKKTGLASICWLMEVKEHQEYQGPHFISATL